MQVYHTIVFNHFRALQGWAAGKDARLTLDVGTFELEVRYRGRYYTLRPLFQARADGRQFHTNVLVPNLTGFGGWRPYPSIQHSHSTDKLLFKRFVVEAGLRTPDFAPWQGGGDSIEFDCLLKGSVGSFGKQLAGPFPAGALPRDLPARLADRKSVFVERFIEGEALKVWFWGATPFFAHSHRFPRIKGDGVATIEQLVAAKAASAGIAWAQYADRAVVNQCLLFQGWSMEAVLPADRSAWIDYRYAQRYEPSQGTTARTDNALPELLEATGSQTAEMGAALAALLKPSIPVPVLITVDGMLDSSGRIWWLEMNTNSVMPPEGYAVMFGDLFG
jgi:hypothetical protein